MKSGSNNFIATSILGVMKRINTKGIKIVVFEPGLKESKLYGSNVLTDLDEFNEISDIIVTDRFFKELEDVKTKVYTRDIFNRN